MLLIFVLGFLVLISQKYFGVDAQRTKGESDSESESENENEKKISKIKSLRDTEENLRFKILSAEIIDAILADRAVRCSDKTTADDESCGPDPVYGSALEAVEKLPQLRAELKMIQLFNSLYSTLSQEEKDAFEAGEYGDEDKGEEDEEDVVVDPLASTYHVSGESENEIDSL